MKEKLKLLIIVLEFYQAESVDGTISYIFSKKAFDFIPRLLGNVTYGLCTDRPGVIASSDKGRGLVLACRNLND